MNLESVKFLVREIDLIFFGIKKPCRLFSSPCQILGLMHVVLNLVMVKELKQGWKT
jgi:hypothetical protein